MLQDQSSVCSRRQAIRAQIIRYTPENVETICELIHEDFCEQFIVSLTWLKSVMEFTRKSLWKIRACVAFAAKFVPQLLTLSQNHRVPKVL